MAGGGDAGKHFFGDLAITKTVGQYSPAFFGYAAKQKPLPGTLAIIQNVRQNNQVMSLRPFTDFMVQEQR